MHIAFCINRLGIIGLGPSITSLIRNCSNPASLHLWFLCADLQQLEKQEILGLLKTEGYQGDYHLVDFDPKSEFHSFSSLHGDWTPYGRLLLVDYVESDTVLYLDSDVVVELDVLQLRDFDFQNKPIAAVGGGRFKHSLGTKFYRETVGIDENLEYFNSGVLYLNLAQWRKKDLKQKCLSIGKKFPRLPSHDQSILNIYCRGAFAKLPKCFNCEWLAYAPKPTESDRMILHFVGSPKPWDPLGALLNNGYSKYREYLSPTWNSAFGNISYSELFRAWNIRRSYARCILNKLKRSLPAKNKILN